MPVTIFNALPVIAFSKNPLWVKLQSDDFIAVVPATSVNYLEFTGAIAADTVKSLTWTGGAAVMTAKAVPDDSGLQFPTGAGDWAYVQSLLPFYKGNPFLDRAYVITADNAGAHPRLIFTAKAKSADYDMTPAAGVGVITPGASDAAKANFRHHLELWIQNAAGTGDELAYSANIPLDKPNAGLTSSDVHEALHAFLDPDYPELNLMAKRCMASVRPWYFKYAQYYGSTPSVRRIYQSSTFVVNKGGLSMQAATVRNIFSELQVNPGDRSTWRLLRQGSKNKLIRKEQPEWLTYINLTAVTLSAQLEITIKNSDASTTVFPSTVPFNIEPGQKYQFQAGYTQLGIAGRQAAGKVPVYYTARVKGAAGYLSAEYAFVIDYNYEEWPRCFVYENAYGAYQTVFTTGKGQSEFDRSKSDAQLAVDLTTAAITGDALETNILIQDKYTVNIGYSRATSRSLDLLRDLFTSHSIFLYDSGKLIPIGINTKNLKDAPDGVNVYASSFDFYPKYAEEVYTEDANLVDDSINDLLIDAGSAPIPSAPLPGDDVAVINGSITVLYGDPHLSVVAGRQRFTAPFHLAGKNGYPIDSSQMGRLFYLGEVYYDPSGYFEVTLENWLLQAGDKLVIWPYKLNPDS